jgi:hypothetical protein
MVELIAACCIPTDLVSLLQDGAGFLPLQIVMTDYMETTSPNTKADCERKKSVEFTHKLLGADATSLKCMSLFWKRVVRNDKMSRAMPSVIKQLSNGTPTVKLRKLLGAILLYAIPSGVEEWILASSAVGIAAILLWNNRYK